MKNTTTTTNNMEYSITNDDGLCVTLSKTEGSENVFVAEIKTPKYQCGFSHEKQTLTFIEPTGGPQLAVGTSLKEYGEDLPDAVIESIVDAGSLIIIKTETTPHTPEEPQTEDSAEAEQEE